ncbi:uncharacterized protein LOC128989480 [Macrosteles quadrilineatus]|uniref:uncharacterized protein LOC128989480 n=1 Tax=Macrosteles quadrilineatus TaxID=74068 RepID=UPI0023E29642|nr:uncharacterized protein LOC128989480 [Macrosteles quadrilineatus]
MCGHADAPAPQVLTMPDPHMALFGMVWLLRMRAEVRRCAKCRREEARWLQENAKPPGEPHDAAAAPIFTVERAQMSSAPPPPPPAPRTPRTFCEVHGYRRKEDIQEFYELTLLDDTKSIQQKTAETIRIANKWEASDGPIAYTNNDDKMYRLPEGAFLELLRPGTEVALTCGEVVPDLRGSMLPLTQALLSLQDHRPVSPEELQLALTNVQKTRYAGDEEELPPPPSPPQLKDVSEHDGIPRTGSERILNDPTLHNHVHQAPTQVRGVALVP